MKRKILFSGLFFFIYLYIFLLTTLHDRKILMVYCKEGLFFIYIFLGLNLREAHKLVRVIEDIFEQLLLIFT